MQNMPDIFDSRFDNKLNRIGAPCQDLIILAFVVLWYKAQTEIYIQMGRMTLLYPDFCKLSISEIRLN